MTTESKSTGVWVFWRYDLFPHLLSGEVSKTFPDSKSVEVVGYGPGYSVSPRFTVKGQHGEELASSLKALEQEKQEALKNINAEYRTRLVALLAEYGVSEEKALKARK